MVFYTKRERLEKLTSQTIRNLQIQFCYSAFKIEMWKASETIVIFGLFESAISSHIIRLEMVHWALPLKCSVLKTAHYLSLGISNSVKFYMEKNDIVLIARSGIGGQCKTETEIFLELESPKPELR